jgi:hypothetical protein
MQVPSRQAIPLGQLAPASAGAPTSHCTQKPTSQKGFVAEQSEACAHSTQRDVVVLQTGVVLSAVQSAAVRHPARHMKVS